LLTERCGIIMPETDQLTTFESIKQTTAGVFNKLTDANTLNKGMAIAGSVITIAGGMLAREAVFNPAEAVAAQVCTTETTTSTAPDGTVTTTETQHCTDSSDSSDDSSSGDQQPAQPKPDKPDKPDHQKGNHKSGKTHHGKTVHGPKVDKTDSQKKFKGYDMGDTAFTDGNGCFITSAASALRRETGDAHVTPRSIYYPALKKMWGPSTGVKGGLLFDALPSIASHLDVKVYKTNFAGAVKAIKNDDEVMMLAAPGHFTSQGHYMAAWKVVNGKRLVIDDPNGKGKHGDSERPGGWSGPELQRAGIIGYRVLHLKD
jgi:hypothetical protein